MSIEEREWLAVVDEYIRIMAEPCPGSEVVIRRLIKLNHIRKWDIVRFMALRMYPNALAENNSHMGAITDIAVQLNTSERTIWSIINQVRTK